MDNLVMVTGIMAALLGAYMFTVTQRTGGSGARQAVPRSGFPPLLLALHPTFTLSALVVWFIYIFADHGALAWLGFALFVSGAALGDVMFLRWFSERRASRSPHDAGATPRELPETDIPFPVVVLHGALAVLTIVFALLAALGIGAARCAGC